MCPLICGHSASSLASGVNALACGFAPSGNEGNEGGNESLFLQVRVGGGSSPLFRGLLELISGKVLVRQHTTHTYLGLVPPRLTGASCLRGHESRRVCLPARASACLPSTSQARHRTTVRLTLFSERAFYYDRTMPGPCL